MHKKETVNKIQQIFNGHWAINSQDYHQLISLIMPSIKAGNIEAVEKSLSTKITAYATQPYIADRWELDDASLPEGSIVVLTAEGILYSWDTYRLERYIQQAIANTNIAGIVLFVNGPGGMILRVDLLEKLIRESPKPIAAYITGVCASAHFWFTSACDRTFISSPMDEVGSVGIVYTYQSLKQIYANQGIIMEDIYPDGADLKNKMLREMEKNNNDELIKEKLAFYHNLFRQAISRNLNIPMNPELPLFRGESFFADVAIANGYIDQMGTLDDAITWVMIESTKKGF